MCARGHAHANGEMIPRVGPEARNLTATTVGPITGGTGRLAKIDGMARTLTSANPKTGMNETQEDGLGIIRRAADTPGFFPLFAAEWL